MGKRAKSEVADLAEKLAEGTAKHFASVNQVTLPQGTFTMADLMSRLKRVGSLRSDVDAARATARDKVAAERAEMPALRTLMDAYVTYVKATVGSAVDLADFGLTPKKVPTPPTVEAKAAAAVKRASTRVARGTMGSKQKLKVKGNVVGISVTPVEAETVVAKAPTAPSTAATSSGTQGVSAPHTAT
jgi:hypothetical protein